MISIKRIFFLPLKLGLNFQHLSDVVITNWAQNHSHNLQLLWSIEWRAKSNIRLFMIWNRYSFGCLHHSQYESDLFFENVAIFGVQMRHVTKNSQCLSRTNSSPPSILLFFLCQKSENCFFSGLKACTMIFGNSSSIFYRTITVTRCFSIWIWNSKEKFFAFLVAIWIV